MTLAWPSANGNPYDPYIVIDASQNVFDWNLFIVANDAISPTLLTRNTTDPLYAPNPGDPRSPYSSIEGALAANSGTGQPGTFLTTETLTDTPGVWVATAIPETPLPAALPLFASGLGALGLLGWRRKKKAPAPAFRLTYEGELRPTQQDPVGGQANPLAAHKHGIRRGFRRQLKHLWETKSDRMRSRPGNLRGQT